MEKFHIAIDGPAGSGKTTVAKALAERLGMEYLDTGAMYRAVALKLDSMGVKPDDEELDSVLKNIKMKLENGKLYMDGKEVGDEIRTSRAGDLASKYAKSPIVRKHLTRLQREIADERKMVVEGRDIGTVVLPDAELKVFLTASPQERARRRYKELLKKGERVSYDEVLKSIIERDTRDSSRSVAPLKPAEDAVVIDTTDMSVEEVVKKIIELARERGFEG